MVTSQQDEHYRQYREKVLSHSSFLYKFLTRSRTLVEQNFSRLCEGLLIFFYSDSVIVCCVAGRMQDSNMGIVTESGSFIGEKQYKTKLETKNSN